MSNEQLPSREQLPSGKTIIRQLLNKEGTRLHEMHCYGGIDIAISFTFQNGSKVEETYLVKNRLVSRKSYEKARTNYPDMPASDDTVEDWEKDLLRDLRVEQKQRKVETERRLNESEESRFPRPKSTNWLRVIAKDKAHLVEFASRDWKILARETSIPTGREWLRVFGFHGLSEEKRDSRSSVAKGLEIGFEVVGDRLAMLETSKLLLNEVINFAKNPPEVSYWHGSIRPRPKPRQRHVIAWPIVLPPLIEFLSGLREEKLKIFNHHQ
jgi:hypothetical protein